MGYSGRLLQVTPGVQTALLTPLTGDLAVRLWFAALPMPTAASCPAFPPGASGPAAQSVPSPMSSSTHRGSLSLPVPTRAQTAGLFPTG